MGKLTPARRHPRPGGRLRGTFWDIAGPPSCCIVLHRGGGKPRVDIRKLMGPGPPRRLENPVDFLIGGWRRGNRTLRPAGRAGTPVAGTPATGYPSAVPPCPTAVPGLPV